MIRKSRTGKKTAGEYLRGLRNMESQPITSDTLRELPLVGPGCTVKSEFGGKEATETVVEVPADAPAVLTHPTRHPKRSHPEHAIQVALFTYIRGLERLIPELALAHAPKNDFKRTGNPGRDFAQWNYLKAEGVQSGVPDVCIPIPVAPFAGFWLELKAPGNKPSEKQMAFLEMARKVGHCALWTDNLPTAQRMVDEYLAPLLRKRGIITKG